MTPTMRSVLGRLAMATLALTLASCGGRRSPDALEAARDAVLDAASSERCAEAEYRAARSLLDQANAAYEARDWARARQLAEAATLQAERARQVAEANREDCERAAAASSALGGNTTAPSAQPPAAPVLTDYELTPVYFEFDQFSLTEQARATLALHAQYLVAHPELRLTVQGHCDELGSSEYNLALGETRARTVAQYLVRAGVAAERLRTVSYGEEMPASTTEQDRNRRAEFVPRY